MAKVRNFSLAIVLVVVLLCAFVGSYAIYTESSSGGGNVTAKSFNTSHTMQENIPIEIWLGETKYWYFTVENVNKKGIASSFDIDVTVDVELKAYQNTPFVGLTLTIEEYVRTNDSFYNNDNWTSATYGTSIVTENTLRGYLSSPLRGNSHDTRHLRIKYSLPEDTDGNSAEINGFYGIDDNKVLNIMSVVDIFIKFDQRRI